MKSSSRAIYSILAVLVGVGVVVVAWGIRCNTCAGTKTAVAEKGNNTKGGRSVEGFKPYMSGRAPTSLLPNEYPRSVETPLLDSFPHTGATGVSDYTYSQLWKYYPVFKVGSRDQYTNNLMHTRNPDNGTCVWANMCGALYKSVRNKSNYVHPLPPVSMPPGDEYVRVNYYYTKNQSA